MIIGVLFMSRHLISNYVMLCHMSGIGPALDGHIVYHMGKSSHSRVPGAAVNDKVIVSQRDRRL